MLMIASLKKIISMKIMKATTLTLAFAMLTLLACTPTTNNNEALEDTTAVINNSELNSSPDSNAGVNGHASDSSENASGRYQESNNNQAPRTHIGDDTTGKD